MSPSFKASCIQIKNHMLLFTYRHDDETNVRLVEGIRAKIKKKWLVTIQLISLRHTLESLCYKAAEWMYFATALTGCTKECRCNENHMSGHRVFNTLPFLGKIYVQEQWNVKERIERPQIRIIWFTEESCWLASGLVATGVVREEV